MKKLSHDNLKALLNPFQKVLNDPNMTYEAKGMLMFLYSMDDLDNFSAKKLIEASASSRDKTRRIFKELTNEGFVSSVLERHEDGSFSHNQYILNVERLNSLIATD